MTDDRLRDFIIESNHIEGIDREPTPAEFEAHEALLAQVKLSPDVISRFVRVVANAELRDRYGMNVYVGNHVPPAGGDQILYMLNGLLMSMNVSAIDPWTAHTRYETIHPYMDGNGRSGRAVWLWQMVRDTMQIPRRLFLHEFYYQTLDHSQDRR